MRILYFGTYSKGPGYPRNTNIIEGLRLNGCEVIECHYPLWKREEKGKKPGPLSLLLFPLRILRAYRVLISEFLRAGDYDCIIVGYTGNIDVFLARLLNRKKRPLVLDAFISLYDTMVNDRRWFREGSLMARGLRWLDYRSCHISDLVLLDTEAHIRYFSKEFGLPEEKFLPLPPGAERGLLEGKGGEERHGFKVIYFGTFLPLHGVEVMVRAAKLVEEEGVHFLLIGKGEGLPGVKELCSSVGCRNIDIIDRWVEPEDLSRMVRSSQVVLGLFGTTEKAGRVIPLKVYGAMALGKAIVTADTPAARELLKDGYNALLVPGGDPEALAGAIKRLKEDRELCESMGKRARETYQRYCTPYIAGKRLKERLEGLIRGCRSSPLYDI